MADETPIVFIGGLGGSGTRAVAGAIAALGYYPGGCLNGPNDNLIFSELFAQRDWLRSEPPKTEVHERLILFGRIMREGIPPEATNTYPGLARFVLAQGRGLSGQQGAVGWMTKEPHSHLFLESILSYWPQAVFVYVVRHPLDMAFSRNRRQLRAGVWLFGLDIREFPTKEAAKLEFWIRAQRRVDRLTARFPERIHALRYDGFVEQPKQEMAALLEALSLPVPCGDIETACAGVIRSESIGRYRSQDLTQFSEDQLGFCRSAGWSVER
ncbi:MAG: sulfotransferase [Bradyrhizobium sp.]|nr:sulfotransferase [Bradyrhizobium sp.]